MIIYKSISAEFNSGMKYELLVSHGRQFDDFEQYSCQLKGNVLDSRGFLTACRGYKWDGASGAIDSADFMEGSMYHDILCEMINAGLIPDKMWNKAAKAMREINKEEGMPWYRRWWTWRGVRLYGRVR